MSDKMKMDKQLLNNAELNEDELDQVVGGNIINETLADIGKDCLNALVDEGFPIGDNKGSLY